MGLGVMIIGESGTGKSASMRNFAHDEAALVNVNRKPLPFRGKFDNTLNSDNYEEITRFIRNLPEGVKSIIVDDVQYLLANEYMRRCKETGFQKFTDMGEKYWRLMRIPEELPDDVILYFLSHTQVDESGKIKAKTIGKLLDEKITVEGMFTVVIRTMAVDGEYCFCTQSRGDTCKSPVDMFPGYQIPNDLRAVDEIIRTYYSLNSGYTCTDCGAELTAKAGSTVEKLISYTTQHFGRKLCATCAQKLNTQVKENATQTVSE